jgi:hypothetical protein
MKRDGETRRVGDRESFYLDISVNLSKFGQKLYSRNSFRQSNFNDKLYR